MILYYAVCTTPKHAKKGRQPNPFGADWCSPPSPDVADAREYLAAHTTETAHFDTAGVREHDASQDTIYASEPSGEGDES